MTQHNNSSSEDSKWMHMALTEAEMALEEGEIPIGAVLVCQDRLIAKAHNLTETLCDVTAHAEMQVFTSASSMLGSKYLKDCTLYVTLQPCPCVRGRPIGRNCRAWCMERRI